MHDLLLKARDVAGVDLRARRRVRVDPVLLERADDLLAQPGAPKVGCSPGIALSRSRRRLKTSNSPIGPAS